MVRRVPRIEVREIPIERVIQVRPRAVARGVCRCRRKWSKRWSSQCIDQCPTWWQPKLAPLDRSPLVLEVKQEVEREIPVPKPYMQSLEVVKQAWLSQILYAWRGGRTYQ